jgi:serine/threonine-protein kinase
MATRQMNAVSPSPLDSSIQPGSLISAYRIEATVGMGGMGWVYRARHALTSQVVAIKVLREEQVEQDRAIDRMMREATILASVSHLGIPKFYECGLLPDRRVWIAMELVEGISLAERLQHGPLCADDVATLIGSVTDVLAAAHNRGVTHRDLKPDNIFLTPHDPSFPVRVIDWGIAHHHTGSRFTAMNEAIGTPTYMSPEQARGGPTDGHCDVYGLGVVAYQALCGKPPFVGQSSVEILVQHLNKPVPPLAARCSTPPPIWLPALIEAMLAKSTAERPSAIDVNVAVKRATSGCDDSGYLVFQMESDAIPEAQESERTGKTAQMRAPRLEALGLEE